MNDRTDTHTAVVLALLAAGSAVLIAAAGGAQSHPAGRTVAVSGPVPSMPRAGQPGCHYSAT